MRGSGADNTIEGRARRGWFAETLVVLGILAFAYFALTIQPPQPVQAAPSLFETFAIG